MIKIIFYILIGLFVGLSMGTIGVGAGLLSMPLLIYSGLSIKQAIATVMVMQLLPQSLPGVLNYKDNIKLIPTLFVTGSSIIGIWIGSYLVKHNYIGEKTLYRVITIFLFLSSIYFFIKHC